MRQSENNCSDKPKRTDAASDVPAESSVHPRRKFVAQAAAAPVLLTVAGRSALACGTVPKGLSFASWCSVNPKGQGTACVSHTVAGHTPCKPPLDWTPQKTGTCFKEPWPTSGCKPFTSCKQRQTIGTKVTYVDKSWTGPGGSYTEMCHFFQENSTNDAGWNTGDKLSCLVGETRSISRILIDEYLTPGSTGLKAHYCTAWLNATKFPGVYTLSQGDIIELCQTGKIGTYGYVLSSTEIKTFLEQTWG